MYTHVLTLALALNPGLASAAAPETAAEAAAKKVLAAGSALFDAKDAAGLAETYTTDAVIDVYGPENGSLTTTVYRGRADIEALYRKLFADMQPHCRNEVLFARFAGPEILVIQGLFTPDTTSTNADAWPFVQVRVKQGDQWRMKNLQLFLVKE